MQVWAVEQQQKENIDVVLFCNPPEEKGIDGDAVVLVFTGNQALPGAAKRKGTC